MAAALEPIVVVGARGMLGRAFTQSLAAGRVAFSVANRPELDLRDAASIERGIVAGTAVVINCTAFTEVDAAETHEADADAVNAHGVGLLATRCSAIGALLVHFSTDYVFGGQAERPYTVDQPRAPLNAYGRSKARGEQALEASGAAYLLIRTSWVYASWGKNFVLTMRELTRKREVVNVVADQIGRPTSALYLAERSLALVRRGCRGLFHVTDGGQCSWYEFAAEIVRQSGSACRVQACTSDAFPRPARRPTYSVLDLARVEAELGPSQPWQHNLELVLRSL